MHKHRTDICVLLALIETSNLPGLYFTTFNFPASACRMMLWQVKKMNDRSFYMRQKSELKLSELKDCLMRIRMTSSIYS